MIIQFVSSICARRMQTKSTLPAFIVRHAHAHTTYVYNNNNFIRRYIILLFL